MHINPVNRFLIKWILITSFGWLIAQTIGLLITRVAFPKAKFESLSTSPLFWIIFGIIFGLSQWINLRDRIPRSVRWVLATTIGFFMAALILKVLNRTEIINSFFREFPIFSHLLGGTIMGFAQYQTLKKTLQKAYWWIIIVGISWTISAGFIGIHIFSIQLLGVLFFTVTTGISFTWLAQNSFTEIQAA